jgi:hypothetical protein
LAAGGLQATQSGGVAFAAFGVPLLQLHVHSVN